MAESWGFSAGQCVTSSKWVHMLAPCGIVGGEESGGGGGVIGKGLIEIVISKKLFYLTRKSNS